jgi:choline dehydrogenase
MSLHYPRGKMLGGCSARNFMIYQRPTDGCMDKWADQVGDTSYTFDNLLPFFEKSVKFTPPNQKLRATNSTPTYSTSTLGTKNGPLSVTFPNWAYAFSSWATRAFSQIGIQVRKEGFQNGGLLGQAYSMFTIDSQTMIRDSSETAFLRRSLKDPTFYVYPLTQGKKIIFDAASKQATGVLVNTLGAQYTISARKEVILSAGVIGSPQLLQVSGVGPAQLLQSLNIPVVADRPGVGQNMQDHVVSNP